MERTHRLSLSGVRSRRAVVAALAAVLALAAGVPSGAAPSGPPIRIGSTLALTGPLAATGLVHKIGGEIFVEQTNKGAGLLGRPIEWVLLDDQSKPDLARTLYEKLITIDKVDLVLGPYGTGTILSAMAVAQRHGKVLVHHTFGIPHLAKYDMHFPTWAIGPEPGRTFPSTLLDALESTGKPPRTIAIVTSKFPSAHFMSVGAREVAKARGLREVLYLEFEFGNRDFGPIAARVRDANPDFLWMGAVGLEGNLLLEALKKIDYTPRQHFHLYPAPGPMALAPEGKHALSTTIFEEHPPFTTPPAAAEYVKLYRERAAKAGLPYQSADVQAAVSYSAWQILAAAATATKGLDDKAMAQWLRASRVDTIIGRLRFDGPNNYGDDLSKVKQVQDGKWVVVWPREFAAPGARLIVP
jgi:branched-chain amino acid transport system substrate-binding protein